MAAEDVSVKKGIDDAEEHGQQEEEMGRQIEVNHLFQIMDDEGSGITQGGMVAGAQPNFQMG